MKKWYAKFLCLTLFFPALASASALPNVFVDEVDNDDPRYEEGVQWIEITNRTREEMDTRGWILPGLTSGGESVKLTTKLKPNATIVIAVDAVEVEEEEEPVTPSLPPDLSEFVSDPEDGGEWVELYNPHDTNVDLSSFKLSDASNKKIALVGTIEPSEYFVVNLSSSLLNNSGDTLNLIDMDGTILDSVNYGGESIPKKGESFAKDSKDSWSIAIPTKGLPNLFPELEEEVIAEEANEEKEEVVVVEERKPEPKPEPVAETVPTYSGTITAPPGLFGSQIAYLNGYQLYLYKADWPELTVGDTVRIKGELGESRSEKRIKLSSGGDLAVTGSTAPSARPVTTQEFKTLETGTLVTVAGKVTARADRTLTIEDSEGTVDSVFIDAIDFDLKTLVGTTVEITGIVRTLNANPRLYPRTADDLKPVVEEVTLEEPVSNDETIYSTTDHSLPTPLIGGGLVAVSAGSGALFYLKHKFKLLT